MPTTDPEKIVIKRALLSVSDKTGIVELAHTLASLNIEILSTSGTAKLLQDAGIAITEVSDYTGFPEIMNGRIKTLHPKVHGALLGRRGLDDAVMQEHRITAIGLVVANLYPFTRTIQKKDCTQAQAIENIDIGGPAMIRSAAKNNDNVTVVVDPDDYRQLQFLLEKNGASIPSEQRLLWAAKAFDYTASYDSAIGFYLAKLNNQFPHSVAGYTCRFDLRYGENPHQAAALYMDEYASCLEQLQGKALSYNNYLDVDAAITLVSDFTSECVCAIIKHTNPCGVACGEHPVDAYRRAYIADPLSAFGGIIAFNHEIDRKTITAIIEQQFVEVIVAPAVTSDAGQALSDKPNVRLIIYRPAGQRQSLYSLRSIEGGVLLQQKDSSCITASDLRVVGQLGLDDKQISDLIFAARIVKQVKSNAIVCVKAQQTVGIGGGQMSRIDALKIATSKAQQAKLSLHRAVLASDAFFPFADSIEYAAKLGIGAIVQPGGSVKDAEVIATANRLGVAMVFTGIRNFKH
ncbi:MAG: bifunctional phosphoribosylaminoimidazolecarboxamide formyltransferase/IMP cyclohydrolase [Chromatiales bacterium]|nr:bifunctional phosphoribosylaminoimidazolecarboxamide formyltransferase/IMP cyclohydrolase [Chromatiales bacterium]